MLELVKAPDGRIKAVCEYIIIDPNSRRVSPDGTEMFILHLEISPEYRGNGIVKGVIKSLLSRFPKAQECRFIRDYKYPGRQPRCYRRRQFEKLVKEA